MREFDLDKIITPIIAHTAVVGKYYYCGDTVPKLRNSFLSQCVASELVAICSVWDADHPFMTKGCKYVFLYPYEDVDVCELASQRELSKWLAQGNGEWARDGGKSVFTDMTYTGSDGENAVCDDVRVRAFGENAWALPTKKYLEEHTLR